MLARTDEWILQISRIEYLIIKINIEKKRNNEGLSINIVTKGSLFSIHSIIKNKTMMKRRMQHKRKKPL